MLGYVPVDRGIHYWYDLKKILADDDIADNSISNSTVAIKFTISVDSDLIAIAFNLSQITTFIASEISLYVTDNLTNYSTDYLMYSQISSYTYNFHKNNPNSNMLFTFWDYP